MRKLLLSSVALVALASSAHAQCNSGCATTSGVITCGNCTTTSISSCCYVNAAPDESTLATWAARKAVESQQGDWWNEKKVDKLTREELDSRADRLTELKKWAKTLSNHIFAAAYSNWATEREGELAARRQTLDQLDVALSLVKGLPQPPTDAR